MSNIPPSYGRDKGLIPLTGTNKKKMFKQVIVLRKDLNMRKGKMVAQGAHASMKAVLDFRNDPFVEEWLNTSFTKIAVSVPDEKSLRQLFTKATAIKIPCSIIIDNGKTEFHGKQTVTAVAIGPAPDGEVDTVTGKLPLL